MKNYYFLKEDNGRYYVAESQATYDKEKALKLKSLDELITTVPWFKDWNVDYHVYEVSDSGTKRVEEKILRDIYNVWKEECPEDYEKLYSGTIFDNIVRTTKP